MNFLEFQYILPLNVIAILMDKLTQHQLDTLNLIKRNKQPKTHCEFDKDLVKHLCDIIHLLDGVLEKIDEDEMLRIEREL